MAAATIDDGGNVITVATPILAPTGNGASAAGLSVIGGGYIGTPVVQITPAVGDTTGTGATANATIDPVTGNLTGIVITNPGVNYTLPPVFTLLGGGLGNNGQINVVDSTKLLAANKSGGFTKQGAGTLILGGVSTYTGPTKVTAGTLTLGINNAISSASTLNMAGGNFSGGGSTFTDQMGALRVSANSSTIDVSGNTFLQFADSQLTHWRYNTITNPVIVNINGAAAASSGGNDTDANMIVFPHSNSLNANELSQIQFGGTGFAALRQIGGTGTYAGEFELVPSATLPTGILTLGDINQDGVVDVKDIYSLMSALSNLNGYLNGTADLGGTATPIRTTGGVFNQSQLIYLADVNFDDHVDNQDVQALINYVASGVLPPSPAPAPGSSLTAVPEPGSIVLFVLGSIPGVWVMRKRFGRRGSELEKSEV